MATKIKLAPSNVAAAIADIDVDVDSGVSACWQLFSPASFAIIFQFCRLLINFLAFFARPFAVFVTLYCFAVQQEDARAAEEGKKRGRGGGTEIFVN